ncbi:MAG TPA: arginase family protein [Bacteroidales bacterium]|nr:arginase family protein [Bacteroidales bacterium]
MVDLNDYFNPVSIEGPDFEHLTGHAVFPHNISIHTENTPIKNISKYKVALLGIPDDRNSSNTGSFKGPDTIRKELYRLAKIPGKSKIIDLGNMKQGVSFNDTIAGLTDILSLLIGENLFPLIIGGSSSLVPAIDMALTQQKINYTIAAVDPRIDYSNERREPDSFNYLNRIINNQKSTFQHYINIGYQTYLNDQQVINRFLKQRSELIRIGDVRKAIYLTEPLFRDSEVAIFDISAVRQSDAPGTMSPSPNGFYGEEICLLSRYAGISDNLKIFGLFDVNPDFDIRFQTAGLAAQILWFFLEGFSQKQYETPVLSNSNSGRFIRYHVRVTDMDDDLIFVKSNLTDRWWMELPADDSPNLYVACSHEDYLNANRNEIPERWVKAVERHKA